MAEAAGPAGDLPDLRIRQRPLLDAVELAHTAENTMRFSGPRFSPMPIASVVTSTFASPERKRAASARRTSGDRAP